TPRCLASKEFVPVHHESHAHAPGLIHETSFNRLGVASVATRSEPARSAGVRPNSSTRHGLTRGAVETTRPFPSERGLRTALTADDPVPVSDMPAQSSKSDSATAI